MTSFKPNKFHDLYMSNNYYVMFHNQTTFIIVSDVSYYLKTYDLPLINDLFDKLYFMINVIFIRCMFILCVSHTFFL